MTDQAIRDRPVIVADHVTKVYRLYERPRQRILDVLGLSRHSKYTEHFALDDVTFSVRRGERLGIIGRNGAGKSTLLKLVSGVMSPTRGEIRIDGNSRALLEIGTGFHPEFTGRDNAKAYFAELGIAGRQATDLIAEVVAFAELEEYIDQPLKTYSTGMKVRLMFAAATAVTPDILVLDEVLGVGDAYFTRKSFDRINEMAHRDGATLLLVSHDIYSSARICERIIWLEKGKVLFDGEPKLAVKAYEDSVRLQEEARLRSKSQLALSRGQPSPVKSQIIHFDLASPDGRPLETPIWFRSVRLLAGSDPLADLPILGQPGTGGALDFEGTSWGDVADWMGSPARPMQVFGSPFHRVAGMFSLSNTGTTPDALAFEWGADMPVPLLLTCRAGERVLAQHLARVGGRGWEQAQFPLPVDHPDLTSETPSPRLPVFGTGRVRVSDVRLLDNHDHQTFTFRHGDAFKLCFDYEVRDPELCERCDIVVAVLRDGVATSFRSLTRSLELCYSTSPTGAITFSLERLMLGSGNYTLTIMIAEGGYYNQVGHQFYTINPGVHVCVRDVIDFAVTTDTILADGTPWVVEGHWGLLPSVFRDEAARQPVEPFTHKDMAP